jgi:hypothetical protein
MSAKPNTPQPSTPSDSAEPDFAQMERMLKAQLDQADKIVLESVNALLGRFTGCTRLVKV